MGIMRGPLVSLTTPPRGQIFLLGVQHPPVSKASSPGKRRCSSGMQRCKSYIISNHKMLHIIIKNSSQKRLLRRLLCVEQQGVRNFLDAYTQLCLSSLLIVEQMASVWHLLFIFACRFLLTNVSKISPVI